MSIALRELGVGRQRLLAHAGRRHGIATTDLAALDELNHRGGMTPGELGDTLTLTSGAVTALLDRLEGLDWAVRGRHPQDRRKVVVRLTKAGERIAQDEVASLTTVLDETTARLPVHHRRVIERFLATAADAVAELVTAAAQLGPETGPTRP